MRRWLAALCGVVCGVGSLAAAHAGELVFSTWRQEDRAAYTALFNRFTEENPGVTVRFEAFPNEQYQTILSTALAGGRGADVIHTKPYGGLEQLAKAGYLAPLGDEVPALKAFPPGALTALSLRADNRIYAVPFASQTLGIFVNSDIFRRAGLTPAADWDGFLALCRTLKEKGILPLANGTNSPFMTEVLTSALTNPFLGPDFVGDIQAGRATFGDPRYVGALSHLLDIRDFLPPSFSGVDYPTMQQLFATGRAAMFVGGSFEIATFRKQNPKLDMDFVAPPAAQPGGPRPVTVYYDGGYAVNAKSPNREDALKLVRFMATKPFGDRFMQLLGNISPIPGVQIDDALLGRVAGLNATSAPYIMLTYFRFESPTGSELLQNAVQRMMSGNETPQQVGDEITAGISRYYPPFQKK